MNQNGYGTPPAAENPFGQPNIYQQNGYQNVNAGYPPQTGGTTGPQTPFSGYTGGQNAAGGQPYTNPNFSNPSYLSPSYTAPSYTPSPYATPANNNPGYSNPYGASTYPPAAGPVYGGPQSASGYGYPYTAPGMPGTGAAGYGGTTGGYPPAQPAAPTGSFIPQTPYSPGYTSPGYQPPTQPPAAGAYASGYSTYGQMGRMPQNATPPQQTAEQMPLNGGGYIPQRMNVRRMPLEISDVILYLAGGILALLFVLAVVVPATSSTALKILFLLPAVGTTVLLWLRPMVAENKRLCYTIIASALCIATMVSMFMVKPADGGNPQGGNTSVSSGTGNGTGRNENGGNNGSSGGNTQAENKPTPTPTPPPEDDDVAADNRLYSFFVCWSENNMDQMVELCMPSWRAKLENPKIELFKMLQNRRPTEFSLESKTGTKDDTSRQFTLSATIDHGNGKKPDIYRMTVLMVNEGGEWYVDPKSLQSNEIEETPDPNVTPTFAPTPTPYVDANTTLYYNPDGGKLYHLDPNCISIRAKYLPLKGHFAYGQINDEPYSKLDPCNVCGAPLRTQ